MTREEVREIIKDTVTETLISLGIDAANPTEMQRDFQFVRSTRKSSESMKTKILMVILGAVMTGLVAAAWNGIKDGLHITK